MADTDIWDLLMLTIGIDQSTTETAITVLTTPDNYNIYTVRGKGKSTISKLTYIRENFIYILNTKIPEIPNVVCIEGGSFRSSGKLFTLGQLSGMLIGCMIEKGYKNIIEIPPTQLKYFISGIGNAAKETVINSILTKYGHDIQNDNSADSFALAMVGYRLLNKENFKYREEAEVIYKLSSSSISFK